MYRKKVLLSIAVVFVLVVSGIAAYGVAAIEPPDDPIRIACVGDSITEGSGYPYKLLQLLGDDYVVGNFGVSGSTASQTSVVPYMEQAEFRQALAFEPDIIVIMLGTNDANPEINDHDPYFEEDYKLLIDAFQQVKGDQQIYIVKSPPILSTNSAYNNTYLVNTVFPHIDNVANALDLPTIDMYTAIGENSEYFADGVHPNDDGADIIASTVYDAIT
jgi:acyl-CoA thioesterase I